MLNKITPLILTYNEAPNISRTLQALNWAKEIIVIDSYSTDETLNILSSYTQVKVFQRKFDTHTLQWNYGLEKVESEWVLALDSDYLLTDKLLTEIQQISPEPSVNGYFVSFKYCVFGKPLRATLLPPRQVLFRKAKAIYIDDGHTQLLEVEGQSSKLSAYIYHDDRKPLSRWLWAQDRYMVIEAKKLLETPSSELSLGDRIRKQKILAPIIIFFYCLIIKGGILDGWRGFYYAFQRVLAELLLAINIIEAEKGKINDSEPSDTSVIDRADGGTSQYQSLSNSDRYLVLTNQSMHLDNYSLGSYTPGAPNWKQVLWHFLGSPIVESNLLPFSTLKVWLLRGFGANIGQKVRIKPGVRVKFPWRLTVGDFVWIGEDTWIDNLAPVVIENHVCLSQGVYLCTGNHDWYHPDFKLIPEQIYIQESSWIAAKSVIGPGVTVGKGAVLALGGVTGRSLEPMTIYAGNPAQPVKSRIQEKVEDVLQISPADEFIHTRHILDEDLVGEWQLKTSEE